jgi:hypothetical protein
MGRLAGTDPKYSMLAAIEARIKCIKGQEWAWKRPREMNPHDVEGIYALVMAHEDPPHVSSSGALPVRVPQCPPMWQETCIWARFAHQHQYACQCLTTGAARVAGQGSERLSDELLARTRHVLETVLAGQPETWQESKGWILHGSAGLCHDPEACITLELYNPIRLTPPERVALMKRATCHPTGSRPQPEVHQTGGTHLSGDGAPGTSHGITNTSSTADKAVADDLAPSMQPGTTAQASMAR